MSLNIGLNPYFLKYEQLMQIVDNIFDKMKNDFQKEVNCDNGCTDCCYALFDLTLIEALYLNSKFQKLDQDLKYRILVEADKADRKTYQIKKKLFKSQQQGTTDEEILKTAAREKVRCPLLDSDKCVLYAHRPLTCRLYGLPLKMGETAVTCSMSGFEPGVQYPTVDMQRLHFQLANLSQELALGIGSKYPELHIMLVPVSMALLTDYNEEYLGIKAGKQAENLEDKPENPGRQWVLGNKE